MDPFSISAVVANSLQALGNLSRYIFSKDYRKSVDQSGLTTTQKEQNAFEQHLTDQAYERQMDADNTKYQRSVADMQAAGINPMMAVSAGVTGPSVQSGSAGSPVGNSSNPFAANLGGLIDVARMNQDYKLRSRELDIQEKAVEADNVLKQQQAAESAGRLHGIELDNAVKSASLDADIEARRLQNALTRGRIREIDAKIEEIKASAQDHLSKSVLNEASVHQIMALLPYQERLMDAQTAEARQSAEYAAMCTLYQQGLIENGYIEALVREQNASATASETNAAVSSIEYALRSGKFSGTGLDTGNETVNKVLGVLAASVGNTLSLLAPVGSVVGLNFHKSIETPVPRERIGYR